jgi:hypothetical protein
MRHIESSIMGSSSSRRFRHGGRWVSTRSVDMFGRQDSNLASPAGLQSTVTMSYFLNCSVALVRCLKLIG